MLCRPFVVACVLCVAVPGLAQTIPVPPLPPAEDSHVTFKSSVELVTLNVTVTDGQGRQLPGLGEADFQVLEDGVPQRLTFFAANHVPLDVALLIDTSSSMNEKLPFVRQAAIRFLRTLGPGDRGEVVGFNSQTKILQAFTSDLTQLETAVRQTVARGGTSLYTAIYITLDQFMRKRAQSSDVRRPAIILLTDGQDTASLIQFDDVLERARRAGVAIYTIAVVSPYEAQTGTDAGGRRFLDEWDYALKSLSRETGGRSFFPMQLSELDGVYGSVAGELSTQYALGYVPRSLREDGAFRRVFVRIVNRPDARPRTRTGYYAPRTTASLLKGQDR